MFVKQQKERDMADGKMMLPDGWEIGWSRDVLIASIERGGDTGTNAVFNVSFAEDAAEAANFLEEDIDEMTRNWKGNDRDLEFIYNFIRRFRN
jgi:hypothetical protein